ncbi:putative L-amino-acid oxidase YobN [Paramyrothecium foliicola]|nr:putative L-amino-acid oxidase YobN [Paramyrothecium foliicola]
MSHSGPSVELHDRTSRDVNSPATGPLLGFLLNFVKDDQNYSDAIKHMHGGSLWNIGHSAALRACPTTSKSDDTGGDVVDESVQDQKTYTDLINGSVLPAMTTKPSVTIVGAGISGLVAGYELKKRNFNVFILEASSRVGGRVITFRDPVLAPGLHAEGGAMRIPKNHYLLHAYINKFEIDSLFPFEMKNKFIYLSNFRGGSTLTYDDFNKKLKNKDPELLQLFPNLKDTEKGKTCDDLFFEAVQPVVELFQKWYKVEGDEPTKIRTAYQKVTEAYDKYTLRSYLLQVAQWSNDALNLFDLGNAHVVFDNGFIESWKDAFLSSNTSGESAGMQQLQHGMDQVPKAFISSDRGNNSLANNITYGARVTNVTDIPAAGDKGAQVRVDFETPAGIRRALTTDYVIFAVPLTAQRAITKSKPFTSAMEQAIRDVRYIEITKILLQYHVRWWESVFTSKGQGKDGGLISDLPIRYTMFPVTDGNSQSTDTTRGAIMAAYTFQQDATILGAMSPERRVRTAAENIQKIFPSVNTLQWLEAGTSQVFPSDELAGGSAFCYFGPGQKSQYLDIMRTPDWAASEGSDRYRVFFAGEHASYTHGWIHGAMEAGLRCVMQVYDVASKRASDP